MTPPPPGRSWGYWTRAKLEILTEHGIERIMTFDRGFDTYPGVERVA